ncbi:hypothetical protein ACFXPZ_14215 [Streptomyces sp. NPDC059101]|uniref:hypothetical protein n=1 Tax=unclassified Streptomyces TaxID=2593676 RepID=UPI000C27DC9A|nr:hypothetical protein [Streptomyces sp. CB02959]PJN36619.1 hypothetical protein CG747_32290 [Streptomyces sp. CB02959]
MTSTEVADLHARYSAAVAAHVADRLAEAGVDSTDASDDVTQEVWLQVCRQLHVPDGRDLIRIADRAVDEFLSEQRAIREEPAGLRPQGMPVKPHPEYVIAVSEPTSAATAATAPGHSRQTRHALTALARTTPARRRLIRTCAEEYLSQIDRHRLPMGYGQPMLYDPANRADAYRMRRGAQLAGMLGISCRPDDKDLPETARAVVAAVDATVHELTAVAHCVGDPVGIAVAYVVAAVRQPRTTEPTPLAA